MNARPLSPDDVTATHKFGEKIDITNCDRLSEYCGQYFSDPAIKTVIFDLENVRLCDSYGLKFLINFQRKAVEKQKLLILRRPDAILKEMFNTTKLMRIFTVSDE